MQEVYGEALSIGFYRGNEWKELVRNNTYFPRFWNYAILADAQDEFVERVAAWKFQHEQAIRGLSDTDTPWSYVEYTMEEANQYATDSYRALMGAPESRLLEVDPDIRDLATPKHTKQRTLGGDAPIPDDVIFPFLVLDSEIVLRNYVRNMAPDIELTKLARSYSRTSEMNRLADEILELRGVGVEERAQALGKIDQEILAMDADVELRARMRDVDLRLSEIDIAEQKLKKFREDRSHRQQARMNQKTHEEWEDVEAQLEEEVNALQKSTFDLAGTVRRRAIQLIPEMKFVKGWIDDPEILMAQQLPRGSNLSPGELGRRSRLGTVFASDVLHEAGSVKELFEKIVTDDYDRLKRYRPASEHRELNLQRDKDLKTMGDLLDVMRNIRRDAADRFEMPVKIARTLKRWNVMTMGGSFMLSSIPDVGRLTMINGMKGFSQDLIPLLRTHEGRAALDVLGQDASDMGAAIEMVLNLRGSMFAEISSDYSSSIIDQLLSTGNHWMFVMNGLPAWNDAMKRTAAAMLYMKVLRAGSKLHAGGVIPADELADFHRVGLDAPTLRRIYSTAHAASGGETIGSDMLPLAPTRNWEDAGVADLYRNAISREVNNLIITPGIGDKPILMNSEVWSTFLQFKTFAFAATGRVVLQGLQRGDAAVYQQLALMWGLGMVAYGLKAIVHGWKLPEDPRDWAYQGMQRSGALGIISEADGLLSSLTGGELSYGRIIGNRKPNAWLERQRLDDRSFGASWSRVEGAKDILQAILEGNLKGNTIRHFRNAVAFNNIFYLDWLFDLVEEPLRLAVRDDPLPYWERNKGKEWEFKDEPTEDLEARQ